MRRAIAILVFFTPVASREKFKFLNGASSAFDIQWLQAGKTDTGPGVTTGHLPSGSPRRPGQSEQSTYEGHAFRLRSSDGRSSASFAHEGGLWNVVGVQEGADGALDVETLGPKQLRQLVLGPADGHRLPRLGFKLPATVIEELTTEWSPARNQPELFGGTLRGGDRCDRFGSAADDQIYELVIISSVPIALEIQWLWQLENAQDLRDIEVMSEAQRTEVQKEHRAAGSVPAPSSTQGPCAARLKAKKGQIFQLAGAARTSMPFAYSGELHVIVATEVDGLLKLDEFDEDAIKILVGDVAAACGELSHDATKFWSCFEEHAVLPGSGLRLPAEVIRRWFERLWGSIDHWRLCSYQAPTAPLERREIFLKAGDGTRTVRADVLRRSPLVLAVHNVSTEEECRGLQEHAGPPDDLSLAFVSGGGHSKSRRTLSKNLYPPWHNPQDVLTILANRFYELARQLSGFELYPEGQEPVNWLYYKPGYEYRPHCDGACGASSVQLGQRVATSLLYCKAAELGGGTVFPPDKLKLMPEPGMMLFFVYNPDPASLTEHSACPVLRGEKTTATQWYREGVSDEVNWEKANQGISMLPRKSSEL